MLKKGLLVVILLEQCYLSFSGHVYYTAEIQLGKKSTIVFHAGSELSCIVETAESISAGHCYVSA